MPTYEDFEDILELLEHIDEQAQNEDWINNHIHPPLHNRSVNGNRNMKFKDRQRDENGYIITNHNDRYGKGSVFEYNQKVQKAALARISKSAKQGKKPSRKDIQIAYGV